MQIILTRGSRSRTHVLQLHPGRLAAASCVALLLMIVLSALAYHFLFLKAAREAWPVVGQWASLLDEGPSQQERVMRQNLDAMAQRLGELQARLVRLETLSERVSGMVGIQPQELPPARMAAGEGGPFLPPSQPSLEQLEQAMSGLEEFSQQGLEVFALIESRLFEQRLTGLMVPNTLPVEAPVGSGFGFRADPFSGRAALHTGLDFAAEVGTPIWAAAGGVVQVADRHPQYGLMVDLDHGNRLVTRYAHASRLLVKAGDVVRRGQKIAEVGSTGRSTGPHLHFEVLVDGVPQNPARFLGKGRAVQAGPQVAVR